MTDAFEARLAKLEREVAMLKAKEGQHKSTWTSEITGSCRDDADFEEIVRRGKELRDAEPPVGD